ncbi:MAG: helix-turn-helix domain-containing protein [Micrococcales bacterium]|nr:helix-turn-helix domain-containing protein [Micrococcales bacterium]MCL2667448.1 helix-turn-helix domain-containing protein [Micrococcales bacterium]
MPTHQQPSVYDGTTGRSDSGGRRTHIIQILRDSREPLSVAEVAERVGIHVNTARFHLESLVYSGMATRETESRSGPGRPRVVYTGTLPNQTHERAQGFRLLAEMLTAAVAESDPHAGPWLYRVGQEWGRYLTTKVPPYVTIDESEITNRLVDKLDALWFAPELERTDDGQPHLVLHNCPFAQTANQYPHVVCQLHAGMINGSLEEMRSTCRLTELEPQVTPHRCVGYLSDIPDETVVSVPLRGPVAQASADTTAGQMSPGTDLARC